MRRHRSDLSQQSIVKELRKLGYFVEIIEEPVDLLVRHLSWPPNIWKVLECKTPTKTGKLRPRKDQPEQDEFCMRHGVPKVLTLDDAIEALRLQR